MNFISFMYRQLGKFLVYRKIDTIRCASQLIHLYFFLDKLIHFLLYWQLGKFLVYQQTNTLRCVLAGGTIFVYRKTYTLTYVSTTFFIQISCIIQLTTLISNRLYSLGTTPIDTFKFKH